MIVRFKNAKPNPRAYKKVQVVRSIFSMLLIGAVCCLSASCTNVKQVKAKWKNFVAKVVPSSKSGENSNSVTAGDTAVKLEYFPIRKGQIIRARDISGKLAFREQISVRSDKRVRLGRARVKVGATVKRGDLLFDVDKKEAETRKNDLNDRLRQAEIEIKAAENQKTFSKRQYERKLDLAAKGIAAKKDIDEAERAFRASESGYQAKDLDRQKAFRELRELTDQLSGADIVAPMNGVITRIAKGSEDLSAGQELATVAAPGKLSFFSSVDEASIIYFQKGDKIQIRSASSAFKEIDGVVGSVALTPVDHYGPRGYEVRIDLPGSAVNDGNLRDGYDAVAILPIISKNDVILAPLAALQTGGTGYFMLVAKSNGSPAAPRVVKTGLKSDLEVEVLSGLSPGDYAGVPSGGVR